MRTSYPSHSLQLAKGKVVGEFRQELFGTLLHRIKRLSVRDLDSLVLPSELPAVVELEIVADKRKYTAYGSSMPRLQKLAIWGAGIAGTAAPSLSQLTTLRLVHARTPVPYKPIFLILSSSLHLADIQLSFAKGFTDRPDSQRATPISLRAARSILLSLPAGSAHRCLSSISLLEACDYHLDLQIEREGKHDVSTESVIGAIPVDSSWLPLSRAKDTRVYVAFQDGEQLLEVRNFCGGIVGGPQQAAHSTIRISTYSDQAWRTSQILQFFDGLLMCPIANSNDQVTLLSFNSANLSHRNAQLSGEVLSSRFPRLHTFQYEDSPGTHIANLVNMLLEVAPSAEAQDACVDSVNGGQPPCGPRPCPFGYRSLVINNMHSDALLLRPLLQNARIMRGLSGAELRFQGCKFSASDQSKYEVCTDTGVAAAHNVKVDFGDSVPKSST